MKKRKTNRIIAAVASVLMLLGTGLPAQASSLQICFGDLDADNIVTVTDAALLKRMLIGQMAESSAGDVDSDGMLCFLDKTEQMNFLLGKSEKITCVCPAYVDIPDALELETGEERVLRATVYPAECLDPELIWKSSDKDVVSVSDDGRICALSAGEAAITVFSGNGIKDVCVITVSEPAPVIMSATVTGVTSYLRVRSAPSLEGEVIGGFAPDTKISIIGERIGDWYHVSGPDRLSGLIIEGYSATQYITPDSEETTPPDETTPPEEITVPEITGEFADKVAALRLKFPEGKYWNHPDTPENNSDTWSDTPCGHHKGECEYDGSCGCMSFDNAIQCMGFAFKIGHELFGTSPRKWNSTTLEAMQPGDYLRYNGHSMIVLTVTAEGITVVEANYDNKCGIFWDRFIPMDTLKKYTLDIRTH